MCAGEVTDELAAAAFLLGIPEQVFDRVGEVFAGTLVDRDSPAALLAKADIGGRFRVDLLNVGRCYPCPPVCAAILPYERPSAYLQKT
jgi:hypothetical protein